FCTRGDRENKVAMETDLILLGRWAETPLIAWPGYCDFAQQTFEDRTGFRPEPFTLLREGLHEQYYVSSTVEPMRMWFKSLPSPRQFDFASKLYQQYYRDAS